MTKSEPKKHSNEGIFLTGVETVETSDPSLNPGSMKHLCFLKAYSSVLNNP